MEEKQKQIYQVRIIIDTNIIFSALLNSRGSIGDIIFNGKADFTFFSNAYMIHELEQHWDKLLKLSALNNQNLQISKHHLFSLITFIDENEITPKHWLDAERLIADVDEDDIDFLALTLYLEGTLWTGDKRLYKGLKSKGFQNVVDTSDLLKIRNDN